ncbi:MAG TPA: IucA/IucC family C-terminal-domain containing protein [Anaerolineales bacterium]|nr:IucA/IucC family C-terminal-domain containing protein [Anaerolineales bacterium]
MNAHPLADTLTRLAAGEPTLKDWLRTERDDAPDWVRSSDLTTDYGARLPALLEQVRGEHPTQDKRAPATLWFGHYAYPVMAVPIACYLAAGRVPDLDPKDLWLRLNDHGEPNALAWCGDRFAALPADPAHAHPGCAIVADRAALRDHLRNMLVAHLSPLIEALAMLGALSRQTAWALAADYNAAAFVWIGGLLAGDETLGAAESLDFAAPPSPLRRKRGYHRVEHGEAFTLMVDRVSCCRYFKVEGGGYCGNCPHRPLEERLSITRDWLVRRSVEAGA